MHCDYPLLFHIHVTAADFLYVNGGYVLYKNKKCFISIDDTDSNMCRWHGWVSFFKGFLF